MAAGLKRQNCIPHSPFVIKATEPTSDNFKTKKFLDWASFEYHDISNQWPIKPWPKKISKLSVQQNVNKIFNAILVIKIRCLNIQQLFQAILQGSTNKFCKQIYNFKM